MRLVRLLRQGLVASLFVLSVACQPSRSRPPDRQVPGGDPERGALALRAHGCGGCHHVPGVEGAQSFVGPPLDRFGERAYVAGVLSNRAENLVRWIEDPRGVDPDTAMPDLGVPHQDALDIAAYLYTLRGEP